MRFELETWGDGSVVLVHWDSMHGNDIRIVLHDGNAYLITDDRRTKIDLVRELEKLSVGRSL